MLVSVFLDGGADSLSMLFPASDPLYYQYRPTLALPQSAGLAFSEDNRLRWHPSLSGLAQLHGADRVSVIPAIGYTSPDKSHFLAPLLGGGATNTSLATGWLGRYLDRVGSRDNPLQGLSLDNQAPTAAATAKVLIASIDGRTATRSANRRARRRSRAASSGPSASSAPPTPGSRDRAIRESPPCLAVAPAAAWAQGLGTAGRVPPSYPRSRDEFPRRLASLAAMLAAGHADPLRGAEGARDVRHARRPGGQAPAER